MQSSLQKLNAPRQLANTAELSAQKEGSNEEDLVTVAEVVEACLSEFKTGPTQDWILDSGASKHITGNDKIVHNLTTKSIPECITTAGGVKMPIAGQGDVILDTQSEKIKGVPQVLYVPGVTHNLLSVGAFTERGHIVAFDKQ